MDYSKYQYVITVAEMQSISRAARELYISQPALTKYINKLEEDLGVKLFYRNVIPITLTYAGEIFVSEAKKILDIKNRLDKELEEICEMKKGRLSIGVSASRGETWLPAMLPVFKKRYPGIELKIIEGSHMYLEDHIIKGMIDIILTTLPFYSDEIDYQILTEEKIVLIAPAEHPLVSNVDLSQNSLDNLIYIEPQNLNGQNFLNLTQGQGISRLVSSIFDKYDIKPKTILETQSLDTAFKLAARGMGLAFVSDICVEDYFPDYLPALCTIGMEPLTRNSIAGYKKGEMLSPAAKAFIDVAKEVLTTCPEFRRISHEDFVRARKNEEKNNKFKSWFDKM